MNTDIGTSNYGSNEFKKRTNMANANWGLKEGSNVYRILPPYGSMAASGFWSKFEVIHWGYVLSNGKQRPFRCVEQSEYKNNNKRIIVHCPQCDKIAEQKALEEKTRNKYKEEELPKELIKKNLAPFADWNRRFNTERRHFLNVLRPDGQIGRLKLSNNAMKALRAEIKRLREKKEHMDPCGIESGVDFEFFRVGMDKDSTYKVSPVYQEITIPGPNGQMINAKVLKSSPLTPDILERFKTEGFDLGAFYKDLSRDEIQILVDSGGNPETVDSIFGLPKVSPSTTSESNYEDGMEESDEPVTLNPALAAAMATVDEPSTPQVDDEEAELQRQLAALRAKRAATTNTSNVSNSDDWMTAYKSNKL